MDELVTIYDKPSAHEIYMVAGWQQWADAGAVSSMLPLYLINLTEAKKIADIAPHGFYLFQLPGTHGFLRPEVKLEEGYRKSMSSHTNEFYYSGDDERGLVIFLGQEPHMNGERYAAAFLDAAKALNVKRVVIVGGVYGAIPYDRERAVSCVYSLPSMKAELERYAVTFSNYEGGVSIGTYIAHHAEAAGVEVVVMYAFVPAYDFSQLSDQLQGLRVESDFKAWHDLMRRINHMFKLGLDLSELERESSKLTASIAQKIDEIDKRLPQLGIRDFMARISADFTEQPFMPLDVWERGLKDLFGDDA
ncbi:MAG: PAC2 family protein [Anaerolineae bacterium]|nr:PAC2 family protein [Thermoflexales bacterium]MDW8406489.1 PAC2 family protein [Anaerolineae bacterium]